jgi:hypothetical protein
LSFLRWSIDQVHFSYFLTARSHESSLWSTNLDLWGSIFI